MTRNSRRVFLAAAFLGTFFANAGAWLLTNDDFLGAAVDQVSAGYFYPGNTHGIPEVRDQYTKAMAEFAWMDHWVRGKDTQFQWKDLLKTLDERNTRAVTAEGVIP